MAMSFPLDGMEVASPYKDGIFEDWDVFEAIHEYLFSDRLRLDPKEFPLMFTEPSFLPKSHREKVIVLCFY